MSQEFTPQTSPMEDWFLRFWFRLLPDLADNVYHLERQYSIGRYYADFAHEITRTVIEIDGAAFHSTKEQVTRDLKRQAYLEAQGWTVLRFTGNQVRHYAVGCVNVVRNHIGKQIDQILDR